MKGKPGSTQFVCSENQSLDAIDLKIQISETSIFHDTRRRFLNNKCNAKTITLTANKMPFYVKLPFISNAACNFIRSNFKSFLSRHFTHIDFRFVFINSTTIHGFLKHKEKLPDSLCSGLVYKYECGACGATYVGQSQKALRSRAGEHLGVSSRTGHLLAKPTQSVVREHLEVCSGVRSIKEFTKVRCFSENLLLKIYESLEITFSKPNLNQEGSSVELFLV